MRVRALVVSACLLLIPVAGWAEQDKGFSVPRGAFTVPAGTFKPSSFRSTGTFTTTGNFTVRGGFLPPPGTFRPPQGDFAVPRGTYLPTGDFKVKPGRFISATASYRGSEARAFLLMRATRLISGSTSSPTS